MNQPAAHEVGPGDAPLLVLVHGAPDRRNAFRRSQALLPQFRTLTYDRRGYGDSATLTPAATLADHADDLLNILDGRRAVAVGHSFGGNIALHAATRKPELFAAVGIYETSMCWLAGWPTDHVAEVRSMAETGDPRAFGEGMARRLIGQAAWDRLDDEGRELRRVEGEAFALDMGFLLSQPYDLRDLTAPFRHGLGGASEGAHVVGARLCAELTGIDPTILDGVSHLVHIQAPDKWAHFVQGVASLAGGTSAT
jgi:pimeloyl-ACP methyl ester carboxylesterase